MPRTATPDAARMAEVVVNVADFGISGAAGVLVTTGLGSCVAVALYDPLVRVAGLAHILLPEALPGCLLARPAKFANTGVPMLVREMRRVGATGRLLAKLAGGARMFASIGGTGVNVGERNVIAVREALVAHGIPVLAADVGGEHGRSVRVTVADFTVEVRSLERGDRVL